MCGLLYAFCVSNFICVSFFDRIINIVLYIFILIFLVSLVFRKFLGVTVLYRRFQSKSLSARAGFGQRERGLLIND